MKLARTLVAILIGTACTLAVGAETSSELLVKADRLWAEGKLDQAQQSFEAAAQSNPKATDVLLRLAGFQLARQQLSASIVTYQKVISQEPKNSRAWIGMGLAYLHSSRAAQARAAFEEAIRVDPSRKEKLGPVLAKLEERKS